ncbi:MAG: hypothetical protein ABI579_02285 [Candidatus Sumerlaeota bacterium]
MRTDIRITTASDKISDVVIYGDGLLFSAGKFCERLLRARVEYMILKRETTSVCRNLYGGV